MKQDKINKYECNEARCGLSLLMGLSWLKSGCEEGFEKCWVVCLVFTSLSLLLPTSGIWTSLWAPVLLQVHSFCSSGSLLWTLRSESSQLTGDPGVRCTLPSPPWSIWPPCWPGGGRQSGATAQSPRSSSAPVLFASLITIPPCLSSIFGNVHLGVSLLLAGDAGDFIGHPLSPAITAFVTHARETIILTTFLLCPRVCFPQFMVDLGSSFFANEISDLSSLIMSGRACGRF